MFKKKDQHKAYLEDLNNQILDKEKEKMMNYNDENNKKYLATLNMGHKKSKCYNCAKCLGYYPLKQLNKKKKVLM